MDVVITEAEAGWTVGAVLRTRLQASAGAIRSAKWSGRIRLNGEAVTVRARVAPGDVVSLAEAEAEPVYLPKPFDLPLCVIYEDEHCLVIDKPAPLASQSGPGYRDGSLENALFSRMGCPADFVYRPVNRLDKGTSGLMLVAKTAHAQQLFQRLLHTPAFERTYLAVTDGLPPAERGLIDLPIGKCDGPTIRRCVRPDGKPSRTWYEIVATGGGRALLRLRLETGRTHQIRVHLSHLGCPVFGDFLYGTESPLLPNRFALHAASLRVRHPVTGALLDLRSPLPPALSDLLNKSSE